MSDQPLKPQRGAGVGGEQREGPRSPAPSVTAVSWPIRAVRGDAQPISSPASPGGSALGLALQAGEGALGLATHGCPGPRRLPPGVWQVPACHLPGDLMASEGLAGALATVLGGKGLLVQSCDSEPAGKPLSPVRLRKNVCYVVLAVFLNEQVSVRPPAFSWSRERAASPGGNRRANGRCLCVALPSVAKHSHTSR